MFNRKVHDLLRDRPLQYISPDETVRAACRMLRDRHVGALAVCRQGQLLGIFSERDVISRVAAAGLSLDDTLVSNVMTPDPMTIDVDADVARAFGLMLDGHFRHLPVTREGRLIGMISMRDVPPDNRLAVQQWREWQDEALASRPSPPRPDLDAAGP